MTTLEVPRKTAEANSSSVAIASLKLRVTNPAAAPASSIISSDSFKEEGQVRYWDEANFVTNCRLINTNLPTLQITINYQF